MKGRDSLFRFKQFSVSHSHSSMKVGVDGVLVGAWGDVEGWSGLDVGCGCGVIALMAAQRNPQCILQAVDIDPESIEEARINFAASPWADRLQTYLTDFNLLASDPSSRETYDFILSNPPFFHSGIHIPTSPREKARHESDLSVQSLIANSGELLKPGGRLSLILPADRENELENYGILKLSRRCLIADHPGKSPKRLLMTLYKPKKGEDTARHPIQREILYIHDEEGDFSDAYRLLTKDFYLKF